MGIFSRAAAVCAIVVSASVAAGISGVYTCEKRDPNTGVWKRIDKSPKSFASKNTMADYLFSLVKGAPKEYLLSGDPIPSYGVSSERVCDRVSFVTDGGGSFVPFVSGNTVDSMQRTGDKRISSLGTVTDDDYGNAVFVGMGSENFALGSGWIVDRKDFVEEGKRKTKYYIEAVNWKDWIRGRIWRECLEKGKPPVILENPWGFLNNGFMRMKGFSFSDLDPFYKADGILIADDEHVCDSLASLDAWLDDLKSHRLGGSGGFGSLDRYGIDDKMFPMGGWLFKYPYAGWSFDDAVIASWFATFMKDKGITKGKFVFDDAMSISTKTWKKRKRFGRKKIYVQKKIDVNTTVYDVFLSSLAFPLEEGRLNLDWNAKDYDFVALPEVLPYGHVSAVKVTPMGHSYSYTLISSGESGGGFHQKITKSKSGWNWLVVLLIIAAVVVVSFFAFGTQLGWALGTGPSGTFSIGYLGGAGGSFIGSAIAGTPALFVSIGSYTFAMSFAGIAASVLAGAVVAGVALGPSSSSSQYVSRIKDESLKMMERVTSNGNFRIEKIAAAPAVALKMEPVAIINAPVMRDMVRDAITGSTRNFEWNSTFGTYASFIIYENRKAGDFSFWGDGKFYEMETKLLDGFFLSEDKITEEKERMVEGGRVLRKVIEEEWR